MRKDKKQYKKSSQRIASLLLALALLISFGISIVPNIVWASRTDGSQYMIAIMVNGDYPYNKGYDEDGYPPFPYDITEYTEYIEGSINELPEIAYIYRGSEAFANGYDYQVEEQYDSLPYYRKLTIRDMVEDIISKEYVVYIEPGEDFKPIERIETSKDYYYTTVGSEVDIGTSIYPNDATVQILDVSTTNDNIAEFINDSTVLAKGEGTARLFIASKDLYTDRRDGRDQGAFTEVEIKVMPEGYTFIEDIGVKDIYMRLGETVNVAPEITPIDAPTDTLIYEIVGDNIVSIDGGKITATRIGETTIRVKDNVTRKEAFFDVTVDYAEVTQIAISKDITEITEGEIKQLSSTVIPSEGIDYSQLVWSSSDETILEVNQDGVIKGISPGTAKITLSAGNGVSDSVDITVLKRVIPLDNIFIEGTKYEFEVGETYKYNYILNPSGADAGDITWETSNSGVVDIDNTGLATAISPGNATISVVSSKGPRNSVSVNVKEPKILIDSIRVSSYPENIFIGETQNLGYSFVPTNAQVGNITWESSNSDIIHVDEFGKITAISLGTADITVRDSLSGVSDTVTINVIPKKINIESINIVNKISTIDEGERYSFQVEIYPETAPTDTVIWESSNEGVVSVSGTGEIIAKAPGSARVTIRDTETGISDFVDIIVNEVVKQVQNIAIIDDKTSFIEGETYKYNYSITPEGSDVGELTWESSNTNVVEVYSDGTIRAISPGSATITLTSSYGASDSVNIEVVKKVIKLETLQIKDKVNSSKPLELGQSRILQYEYTPLNATINSGDIIWKSENDILSVESNGVDSNVRVTANRIGPGRIILTNRDRTLTDYVDIVVVKPTVHVSGVTLEGVPNNSHEMVVGATFDLKKYLKVLPEDATNKNVEWVVSDSNIVSVTNGVVQGKKVGEAYVHAKSEDGSHVSNQIRFIIKEKSNSGGNNGGGNNGGGGIVTPPIIELTEKYITIKMEESYRIPYKVNSPQVNVYFEYSNERRDSAIVELKEDGTVIGLSPGTAVIQVHNGRGFWDYVTVRVLNEYEYVYVRELRVERDKIEMRVGDIEEVKVEILPTSSKDAKLLWGTSNRKVVRVDNGKIEAVGEGKATITVTAYNTRATAEIEVEVKPYVKPAESIVIENPEVALNVGGIHKINYEITPKDTTMKKPTFTTKSNIIKILDYGIIHAVDAGVAEIEVSVGEGEEKITQTVRVTVEYPENFWKNTKKVNYLREDKDIEIKFNMKLDAASINDNVYLSRNADGNGERVKADISLGKDGRTIVVKNVSENGEWKAGETLYMFIKPEIKSITGQNLGTWLRYELNIRP